MENTSIGILGGMGPQASVLLHKKIIELATQEGAEDCHEFPLVTHISLPVRDFISDPSARHLNSNLLKGAVQGLAAARPDAVVIACNTAHLLVEDSPELASLPLVSLPDAVITEAIKKGVSRLGLLASPTTLKTRLYEKHAQEAGVEIVQPEDEDSKQLEAIIRRTIAGKNTRNDELLIRSMADRLIASGAEAVALGCTELSVIMSETGNVDLIDSLSAAAHGTLSQLKQEA